MGRNTIRFILITITCTLIILFSANSDVHADIYRYIDESGVMHFTNTPTSSTQKYQLFLREKPKTTRRYYSKQYDDLITQASERYGVSFPLLKAIIKAESDFDTRAVSKKGAKGLMQIMPKNFKRLGIKDPFNPKENINAGTRYFKQLYERFNGKLAKFFGNLLDLLALP